MTHEEITSIVEELAPLALQESYDNSGYIVGKASDECSGVLICFDCTLQAVDYAIAHNCNLIVSHHPLIFHPIKQIVTSQPKGAVIERLLQNKVTHYAAHTNLDNTIWGVNAIIQELFELENYRVLKPKKELFRKLIFYVPQAQEQTVKKELFKVGAGSIGEYTCCSFSSSGIGSFMPGDDTNPHVGIVGKLHHEEEYRVEMIMPIWLQSVVLRTLTLAHPYEEVAYDIVSINNTSRMYGGGIVGDLSSTLSLPQLFEKLNECFGVSHIRHSSNRHTQLRRIAFCGGSGSSLIPEALAQKADVYITGDLSYHHFIDNMEAPTTLIDIGHKESEQHVITLLHQLISTKLPSFATHIYKEPYSIITTHNCL